MSAEFEDITNWAAVAGVWDFFNGRRFYKSPEDPQWPHGILRIKRSVLGGNRTRDNTVLGGRF